MCILYEAYPFIDRCLQFGKEYTKTKVRLVDNHFWKNVLGSFYFYQDNLKPKSWSEFLTISLWYNQSIKLGGVTVFYESWYEKGIY